MGISQCAAAGRPTNERKKTFISSSPLFTIVALWGWKSQILLLLFHTYFFFSLFLSFLLLLTLNPSVVHFHRQVTERSPQFSSKSWCPRSNRSFICFYYMFTMWLIKQEWMSLLLFYLSNRQINKREVMAGTFSAMLSNVGLLLCKFEQFGILFLFLFPNFINCCWFAESKRLPEVFTLCFTS